MLSMYIPPMNKKSASVQGESTVANLEELVTEADSIALRLVSKSNPLEDMAFGNAEDEPQTVPGELRAHPDRH
jgi:hypothetical protein